VTYEEAKRAYWVNLMAECAWNVSAAAHVADMDRTTVYKTLRRLGIALPVRVRADGEAARYWQRSGRRTVGTEPLRARVQR
jgi:hypothetical protein